VLNVFVRAFQAPDLRKKLLFSGAMIVLFRFGSNLPAPGVSEQNVRYCSGLSRSTGVFAIVNLLSRRAEGSKPPVTLCGDRDGGHAVSLAAPEFQSRKM
jgi:hypothetical protein